LKVYQFKRGAKIKWGKALNIKLSRKKGTKREKEKGVCGHDKQPKPPQGGPFTGNLTWNVNRRKRGAREKQNQGGNEKRRRHWEKESRGGKDSQLATQKERPKIKKKGRAAA